MWGDHLQSLCIQECSEVKNIKTDLIILITSGLVEFRCFGFPVALGEGQDGWVMWVHGELSPYMCTCTHIEFANDHPHRGIHVYHD